MFNILKVVKKILLSWVGIHVKTFSDQDGELSRSK